MSERLKPEQIVELRKLHDEVIAQDLSVITSDRTVTVPVLKENAVFMIACNNWLRQLLDEVEDARADAGGADVSENVTNELHKRSVVAQEAALDAVQAIADQAAYDRQAAEASEARMKQWRDEELAKRDEANAAAERYRDKVLEIEIEKNAILRCIAEALERAP